MQFPINDLQYAISSLSNLISAGVMTADACREMQSLQPKHADYWKSAAKQSANGQALSETLRPILDAATYSAINAAENSGTLPEVFTALEKAMEENREIRKTLLSIIYPFAMLIAALCIFTMFLAFVVPSLASSMPSYGEKSTLNTIADALHAFLVAYNWHIAVVIGSLIFVTVYWVKNPENRNTIVAMLDQVPLLGPATRDLYYGEWATHMAINTHAGITVLDAIKLTHKMMPAYYHPELLAIANDATRLGLATAATPKETLDPRNRIPFLIANAFRFAERTGAADVHFQRAALALITQGKKRINIFVTTATNTIIPITAILGAGSILPYFMQIGESFSRLH
jgi:type II secretory pathway component PulF